MVINGQWVSLFKAKMKIVSLFLLTLCLLGSVVFANNGMSLVATITGPARGRGVVTFEVVYEHNGVVVDSFTERSTALPVQTGISYIASASMPVPPAYEYYDPQAGKYVDLSPTRIIMRLDYEDCEGQDQEKTMSEAFDPNGATFDINLSCSAGEHRMLQSCPADANECECCATSAPSPAPSPAPTSTKPTGGCGDPHFHRWGRKRESFHGECDLLVARSKRFRNGVGFELHVRTTIVTSFSYIHAIAVRVGDDIFELVTDGFFINGQKHKFKELPLSFGEKLACTASLLEKKGHHTNLKIDLGGKSSIKLSAYREFLNYEIDGDPEDFWDSVGLTGEYATGDMYSRDGRLMMDFEENCFEWQVNAEDPKLFHDTRPPQLPNERCRMPTEAHSARRFLRAADSILAKEAQTACAHHEEHDFELCVADVISTGDVGIAESW